MRSLAFAPILLALLAGCANIEIHAAVRQTLATARPTPPGSTGAPPAAAAARTGPLLVVMSYGFGCSGSGWGNGLRDVAAEIRRRHPEQQVITRGWNDDDDIESTLRNHAGPVALIGHSFGGSKSVEMTHQVGRPVNWLVLLDPVPAGDWAIRHPGKYFQIPASVLNAACFVRAQAGWPVSYPIVNPITPADNRFRSIGHSAFCADAEVRDYVLNLCDHEALIQRQAAASRLAQQPRGGGQQAANDRHQDQIGNEIRDEHQGQPSPQGNHPPRLLAIHEHPHSDGPEDK
jgi:pimeloyl-ACP methyl ester carboxylesterase